MQVKHLSTDQVSLPQTSLLQYSTISELCQYLENVFELQNTTLQIHLTKMAMSDVLPLLESMDPQEPYVIFLVINLKRNIVWYKLWYQGINAYFHTLVKFTPFFSVMYLMLQRLSNGVKRSVCSAIIKWSTLSDICGQWIQLSCFQRHKWNKGMTDS